jgi:cell volume regulation protein A
VPWRQQAFLSWAGLRGAVPIVLTTIPLAEEVPGAADLFDLVIVLVVVYTLLQAPTLGWAADRLGVATPDAPQQLDVETAPLEGIAADLLHVRVGEGSKLHGVEITELRLPRGTSVSLVVRGDVSFTPEPSTRLILGDEVLVVTPRSSREPTEARLRAVAARGRLAGWSASATDSDDRRRRR